MHNNVVPGVNVAWMSPEPRAQQCGSWFSHRTTVRYIRFISHIISTFVVIHLSVKVNLDNLILWEDIGWTKDYPVRLNEDSIMLVFKHCNYRYVLYIVGSIVHALISRYACLHCVISHLRMCPNY